MRFSIVISVYNKEFQIENTLNSVLKQTVEDYEIIIVNDGSTDGSLSKIALFKDHRIRVYSTSNKGAAAARNLGISKATGPCIALLDGDDYWHPFYLEEIVTLQEKFPEEQVFASAIEIETTEHTYPASYSIPVEQHQVLNYFKGSLQHTLLSSSSVVLKPIVFKTVGLFNEAIISGQDTDLWIRIGLQYPIAFSRKICVSYIDIASSLSNTTVDVNKKCRFDTFATAELDNPWLKKVLDLNRYSMALLSKLTQDQDNFNYFIKALDKKNLNWKQRVLLMLPSGILKKLLSLKKYLKQKKVILSVFK